MKKILYLTFYYEPDLCAGSFRNTPLVKELAKQAEGRCTIDVLTTVPNRYQSFSTQFDEKEVKNNLEITRISLPVHKSGFIDQIRSFAKYFFAVRKMTASKKYDLVVASSSRLFTAYLGYTIAKKQRIPLYLDIRDIFVDTMKDVMPGKLKQALILPFLKHIERKTFSFAKHINLISEGFRPYFAKYHKASYSYFTNGIDSDFLLDGSDPAVYRTPGPSKVVTYAGNIGEGQGLHKIIPDLAERLGIGYHFRIIGDGGAIHLLEAQLTKRALQNVTIEKPVKRKEIIEIYKNSDFIFIHLNDYAAFEKVLPSKVFEAGAFPRPMIAGVNGYAREFIKTNIDNSILFAPADAEGLINSLHAYQYRSGLRDSFIARFKRSNINESMASSMLQYIL